MRRGPTPEPVQAPPAVGLELVTKGYVPWSRSSIAALCPFKEDFLAFTDIEVRRVVRILDVLADLIGIAEVFFEDFIVIEAFRSHNIFSKRRFFKVNIDAQFLGKYIAVHEVADADAYAVDFVGIARSDTVFTSCRF